MKTVRNSYHGDRYTRIRYILKGIDNKGTPVYSEYMYDVELK